MFTSDQLKSIPDPLYLAYNLQEQIQECRDSLSALEVEYNQIVAYCRENGVVAHNGFAISVRPSVRRTIIPERFAELFPNENELLVAKHVAFVTTELDKVKETKILPMIRIEDTKNLVGDFPLSTACKFSTLERILVVKEEPL